MITDISNFTLYELASIKGEEVSICRYQYYDSDYNEGFVIRSESFYFFVRIKTELIAGEHEVHFLIVKDFHNCELNDAFQFTPLFTGKLNDLILFKRTRKGLNIHLSTCTEITTECGMLLEFEHDERFLIYPQAGLFSNTSFLSGTDNILDVIGRQQLAKSRMVTKDERLLQPLEQYESLPAS